MVLFHSSIKSPRLDYVLDHLFRQRLKIPYSVSDTITSDNAHWMVIHYGDDRVKGAWNIPRAGLLEEKGLSDNYVNSLDQAVKPLQFDLCQFDVLSEIFFHLSRCEEYAQDAERDVHQRFSWKNSCISKEGLLETPFIDLWIDQIKQKIKEKITNYEDPDKFKVVPSLDIDSVFSYKGRSVFRQSGAIIKDLLNLNLKELCKRGGVVLFGKKDPNDNFEEQQTLLGHRKMNYFVQVSDHGPYDKNVPIGNTAFQNILKNLVANGHKIGSHPGYETWLDKDRMELEILRLSNALQMKIERSRQHYLRFRLPETYQNLISCGIREDHSMGYSEVPGFRAGTAFPFKWYDLKKEMSTDLTIVPFCVMDVAYKQFMKFDVVQSIEHSDRIKSKLRALSAPFVFVFHNESLSGHRGWENWNLVFKNWLSE